MRETGKKHKKDEKARAREEAGGVMKTEAVGDGSRDLDTTVRRQMRVMLGGVFGWGWGWGWGLPIVNLSLTSDRSFYERCLINDILPPTQQ